ncbi:hypothetical protein SARC_12631 [Sphaeroforma arctica JP610]|uniref:Uncharacterized protein n=1 Tax=Sphaeroforma arctica JP610 TaxID=667725 RepID=A0A0L0FDI0_9EUKA|nr:hypothetical protein SARC_12631 [Sphaeroforma arctica JP610]KNC74829.1 hypothetical protein SARC_12631 [Sphaeroforma arctica JP610]|eukprot:XP_014148731.1 hypothetical protein SARC_12631 [Sphaeroforma arctica JP610]
MRADLRQRAIPDTVLDTAAADGPSVDEMKKYNNSLTKAGNALDTFFTPRTLDVLVLATATDPKKTMDALRLMKDVAETFELPITMHTLAIATAACMRAIETPASQFEGQEWYPAKLWVQMEQGLAEHQQGVVDSELSLDVLNLAIKHKRTGTVRSVVQSILSRDVELDLGTFIKIFTLAANMQDGTLADWAHQKLERRNMNMSDPFVTGAMANAYLSTRNYCKVFEIYYFEKKKREKSTLHNTTSPEDSVKSPELLHLPGLLAMHHWDGSNAMEAANQILRSHQSADAICNLLEGVGKHFKLHPDRGTATAVETVALLVQTFASDPQHKQLMSLDSVERLFSDVFHSNPTNHTRMYTFALGVLPERNEKLWAWTRMLDIAATSAANGDLATLTELVDDVLPMMDGLQFTFDDLTQLDTKTRLHAGEKLEVCEKLLDVDQAHRLFKMFGMSE